LIQSIRRPRNLSTASHLRSDRKGKQGSLAEIDHEIAEGEAHRDAIQVQVRETRTALEAARYLLSEAQAEHHRCSSELAALEGRLAFLQEERKKFALWETGEEPAPSDVPSPT